MPQYNPETASYDQLKQLFSERCETVVASKVGQVALSHDTLAIVNFLPIEDAYSLDISQIFTDDFLEEAIIYKEVTIDSDLRLFTIIEVESNPTPSGYNNLASQDVLDFQAKADELKYANKNMHDYLTEVLDPAELRIMHAMLQTGREELLDYLQILDTMLVAGAENQ